LPAPTGQVEAMNTILSTQSKATRVSGIQRTYSGKVFNILCPNPDMVDIDDIAHALAHLPLYNGRTERLYSIAQHSVEVARRVRNEFRMAALFHHAAAAYMGDISMVRDYFPDLKFVEERIQAAVYEHFGVDPQLSPDAVEAIRQADLEMQASEHRDLLPPDEFNWLEASGISPGHQIILPVSSDRAKRMFKGYIHYIEAQDLLRG